MLDVQLDVVDVAFFVVAQKLIYGVSGEKEEPRD